MSELNEVEKQLADITAKHKVLPKHTNFQIEYFMLGKEPTINGKIWQCIRELDTRNQNLNAVNLEIEEAKDNIELAKLKLEYIKSKPTFRKSVNLETLAVKKKEINLRKLQRRINSMEATLSKTLERKEAILLECKTIIEVFNKINPDNRLIDIDNKENQSEYWNNKFAEEINLSAMLGMPPSAELIKSVLALPDNSPTKIQLTNAISGAKKLLN